MLGLDAFLGARYGSYPQMLDVLREPGQNPRNVGRQLFERVVFNIAIGNNDDHARNHAAFWDGQSLELTPAFDLTPQIRSTDTSAQAMAIDRDGSRASQFSVCVAAEADYGLSDGDLSTVAESGGVTGEAGMADRGRGSMFPSAILNI